MTNKIALITTTINVPDVLALYRAHDPDVRFFVAGDLKTPKAAVEFCDTLPNTRYIAPDDQKRWRSAEWVPYNCIQRRNFALLEALEWGADVIVSIDDDNVALPSSYFAFYATTLLNRYSGPCVTGFNGWFDPGVLLVPPASHRGFPHEVKPLWGIKGVTNKKIGVCAGLCIGDPDISAITRIANAPIVHGISELGRAGVAIDPMARAVYNTQNVAFRREFAPAMLLVSQFKRFDDILAALVCQRIMQDFDAHLHIGNPVVWQDRNPHRLLNDLRDEMWGMDNILGFAEWLDSPAVALRLNAEVSVVDKFRALYTGIDAAWYQSLPVGAAELASAWADDCEGVL